MVLGHDDAFLLASWIGAVVLGGLSIAETKYGGGYNLLDIPPALASTAL